MQAKKPYHFGWVTYFTVIHILGFVGVWYAYQHAATQTIWMAVVYFFAVHLSITIGAHRYYAHRAIYPTRLLRHVLVLLFSGAAQGPIIWWAAKHIKHHFKEDQPEDPHSPLQGGFFHSHMGWVMRRDGLTMPEESYVKRVYMICGGRSDPAHWQLHNYWLTVALMAVGVPVLLGSLWGDPLGGLMVGVFARLVFQYHLTWVINSACHLWGERTGTRSATNIGLLSILTVGESWHSNHHVNAKDFRLGRKWYEIDPGAFVIRLCFLLGLASRRPPKVHVQ